MKKLLIVSILCVLCSSCSNKFGIGIYDIRTKKNSFVASEDYREFILNISDAGCHFYTWQPVVENLVIRERDCQGVETKQLIGSSLKKAFQSKNSHLISRDGKEFVFFQDGSLWLYDTDDAIRKELFQNIDTRVDSVHFLEYISTDKILAVLKPLNVGVPDYYSVVVIDKKSGNYEIIYDKLIPSISRYGMYAVSVENNLFAFFQSAGRSRIYGDVVILDLETKKVVGTITNESNTLFGNLSWNTNGMILGYVDSNKIRTYSMQNSVSNTIKVLEKSKTCYHLDFLSPDTVIYMINDHLSKYSLNSIDITTGKEGRLLSSYFNGDIFITADRKKIIYSNGY